MPTTRRRVNLTLTETEERFLDAITTAGADYDLVLRYLEEQALGLGYRAGATLGLADIVHVLLRLGLDRLEYDLAEISYAAEAAAYTAEDRARSAARQHHRAEHIRQAAR